MPSQVDTFRVSNNLDGIHTIPRRLSQQLVIKEAVSFRKTEVLNKLIVVRVVMIKDHVNLDEIFLERSVFVPEFNFEGIITRIKDLDKDRIEVYISELGWHFTRRKYKINDVKKWVIRVETTDDFSAHLQDIIDSANLDMPFTWLLGDGIPTGVELSFDANDKNHYEILKISAINAGFDLWFEGNKVYVGTKGKEIKVNRNDVVFKKLNSDINLNNVANIVNVTGGKKDDEVLSKTVTNDDTNLKYNYETSIVNTDIVDQPVMNDIADKYLINSSNTDPDVTLNVSREIVDKYNFEGGDIVEVISKESNQTVKGRYKIVDISMFNDSKNPEQIEIKLKNNLLNTFVSPNTNDILNIFHERITNLELENVDIGSEGGEGGGGGGLSEPIILTENDKGTAPSSVTIDWSTHNYQRLLIDKDTEITMTGFPPTGKTEPQVLTVVMDGTGKHAVTFFDTFSNNFVPLVSRGANAVSTFAFYNYLGSTDLLGFNSAYILTIEKDIGDQTVVLPAESDSVPLYTFRMPRGIELVEVKASLDIAGTTSDVEIDILEGASSIFSTLLTLSPGVTTSKNATVQPVLSAVSLGNDNEMSVFLTKKDDGGTGKALKISIVGFI